MRNFLLSLSILTLSLLCLSAQDSFDYKIDGILMDKFQDSKQLKCLIVFDQDHGSFNTENLRSKTQKTTTVYNTLKRKRDLSQKRIIQHLEKIGVDYNSFIIVNAIAAKLNLQQALDIARFTEVKDIVWDPEIRMEEVKESSPLTKNITDPEWGIRMINADSVWQLGIQGQGVIIAGQDTGYDWEHPVLRSKYRGLNDTLVDHNYNWHDAIYEINSMHGDSILDPASNPCGLDLDYPCDDHNHGTHTMGTMVGSDSTNLIGVAPAAKWMACRNMERGIGTPSTYLECFEWFLAPTDLDGMNPTPELAPDVINNSWSCPEEEGCNETNWNLLRQAIINLKAAGVVVVVSAGNNGSRGCGSIFNPPAIFQESFSVGATKSNDTIAGFSSLGPVIIDSSFILKPDVSAPGHNVRSCIRDGGFANFSGTSMAGPHVAGTVALILSANPSLKGQVELIEDIIRESAIIRTDSMECFGFSGLADQNHIYGFGRIDALKAVQMALAISDTEDIPQSSNEISIYPNPSSDLVYIDYGKIRNEVRSLRIFDLNGRLVYASSAVPSWIHLYDYDPGIYYLQFGLDSSFLIRNLVISR